MAVRAMAYARPLPRDAACRGAWAGLPGTFSGALRVQPAWNAVACSCGGKYRKRTATAARTPDGGHAPDHRAGAGQPMSAKATFRDRSAFAHGTEGSYRLLPFRFARLPEPPETVLLTNDLGDWILLATPEFEALVQHRLDPKSHTHQALRSRGFIAASRDVLPIDLLAARLRTRKSLGEGPSLAIFVVTLRCGQSCHYCQVSRRRMAEPGFDMSAATMAQAVDRLFELPARQLTVEFQ